MSAAKEGEEIHPAAERMAVAGAPEQLVRALAATAAPITAPAS